MSIRGKSTFGRPVRLQDVADAAGISLATASLAINGKGRVSPATQQRVLHIAHQMGFEAHPSAQLLATGHRGKHIGLFTRTLDAGIATKKLLLLQSILIEKGYDASIYSGGNSKNNKIPNHAQLIHSLRRQRPLAIACLNGQHLPDNIRIELEQYVAMGGFLVTFDMPLDLECDQVIFDRTDSADKAITHLLELGHREIGFAMQNIHADKIRTAGMQRALERFGLKIQPELLFDCERSANHEEAGKMLAEQFLSIKHRPSALCIPDDLMAASFIATLYRKGIRVPKDVSVVSHDDLPIAAHNFIPITTVAQPLKIIAQKTADLLTSRVKGEYAGAPRIVQLRGELIMRQSTAPFQQF